MATLLRHFAAELSGPLALAAVLCAPLVFAAYSAVLMSADRAAPRVRPWSLTCGIAAAAAALLVVFPCWALSGLAWLAAGPAVPPPEAADQPGPPADPALSAAAWIIAAGLAVAGPALPASRMFGPDPVRIASAASAAGIINVAVAGHLTDPAAYRFLSGWLPFLATLYALVVGVVFAAVKEWFDPRPVLRRFVRIGRPGHCHACDYDLRGNASGRCPECGTPVVD